MPTTDGLVLHTKPLNVRLTCATSENRKRIAVAIAAMWKKVGVNVELVNVDQRESATPARPLYDQTFDPEPAR